MTKKMGRRKYIFKKWVQCINTSPTNPSLQNKFIQKKILKKNYDIRPPPKKKDLIARAKRM